MADPGVMGRQDRVRAHSLPERRRLIGKYEQLQAMRRQWLRDQVVLYDRIDLLCTEVLGYQVLPHHLRILQHQHRYADATGCLIQAWRGSGKSTSSTVGRAVWHVLRNPNVRILLASRSGENAEAMLTEIKAHLENPDLQQIFGPQVGAKWDSGEIKVAQRTTTAKEATITCLGVEGAVVSKHFDVIICDDLVDEKNARTKVTREQVHTFFYKTLLPTLEPGGQLSVAGTRYHDLDLYGHLQRREMAGARTLVIPALEGEIPDNCRSNWPAKFTREFLLELRERMGSIIFDTQYQCDTAKMRSGGIFQYEDVRWVEDYQIPAGLPRYMGVDLAIGKKSVNDRFFLVVVAYDEPTDTVYVVDHVVGRFPFAKQRELVADKAKHHNVVRGAIETQQYQEALLQEVIREDPDLPLVGKKQDTDKVARAQRQSARWERGGLAARVGQDEVIGEVVGFPDAAHDDAFDGLDLAIGAIFTRRRKPPRDDDFGLI